MNMKRLEETRQGFRLFGARLLAALADQPVLNIVDLTSHTADNKSAQVSHRGKFSLLYSALANNKVEVYPQRPPGLSLHHNVKPEQKRRFSNASPIFVADEITIDDVIDFAKPERKRDPDLAVDFFRLPIKRIAPMVAFTCLLAAVVLLSGVLGTQEFSRVPNPMPAASRYSPFIAKGSGIQVCVTPSIKAMRAWRKYYSVIALYIGGQDDPCKYGYLTPSWVRSVEAQGWKVLPEYEGPQAPVKGFQTTITHPVIQGATAAKAAIIQLRHLGLPANTPIFYDMEAWDDTNKTADSVVASFLDSWDKELNNSGYYSGVYMSADCTFPLVNSQGKIREPNVLWIALWDNQPEIEGSPYINLRPLWANRSAKEYAGDRTATHGGFEIKLLGIENFSISLNRSFLSR